MVTVLPLAVVASESARIRLGLGLRLRRAPPWPLHFMSQRNAPRMTVYGTVYSWNRMVPLDLLRYFFPTWVEFSPGHRGGWTAN